MKLPCSYFRFPILCTSILSMIANSQRILPKLLGNQCQKFISSRHLSLLESRSKELLRQYDVGIQNFAVVHDLRDIDRVPSSLSAKEYVVKAQVHAGGRGKGHFDTGFKSGVHLTKDPSKIKSLVENMLGHRLITKQTPKDGILVKEVMIAEAVDIQKETYFCILMDRAYNGPVIIASPQGGWDIESVAEKTPHLIKTIPVDIHRGITDDIAKDVCTFIGLEKYNSKVTAELKKLWKLFLNIDAVQIEINPFILTPDERIISMDAKVQIDDNATFRQKDIFEKHDHSETNPKEVEAAAHNLSYIAMDGNIGCLVNGAGLAMATMDIIKLHGGEPANFLDVGGNVNEQQVYHAFNILLSDSQVKSILVNVFGGIVNCATIAKGIINATANLNLTVPLTVRLEGTNVEEGRKLLENSNLGIQFAANLDEAARLASQNL